MPVEIVSLKSCLQDTFWTFCTKRWSAKEITAENILKATQKAAAAFLADPGLRM